MTPKHQLSILLLARDEEDYLPEFIEFHLLQGIDHFYVIEHDPTNSNQSRVLEPYVQEGLATHLHCSGPKPQIREYNKFMKSPHAAESEWIAVIDCDEFLFSPTPTKSIKDILNMMPKEIGAYAVHWSLFGSNGHKLKSAQLVTERFTKKALNKNPHVKSIVRPHAVDYTLNPHAFHLKKGYKACRGFDWYKSLPKEYGITEGQVAEPLRLNHYHTKSENEYIARRTSRPRADSGQVFSVEDAWVMFRGHDVNEIEDKSATVCADKIKERLKARGLYRE